MILALSTASCELRGSEPDLVNDKSIVVNIVPPPTKSYVSEHHLKAIEADAVPAITKRVTAAWVSAVLKKGPPRRYQAVTQ